MLDTRFPTALQILLSLTLAAEDDRDRVQSTELAHALGTNASLVRKVMAQLVRAGLVTSSTGPTGGVRLARLAARITLREVFVAVVGGKPLLPPRTGLPRVCLVSSNFEELFAAVAGDAEHAMLAQLGTKTLADGLAELRAIDARKAERGVARTRRRAL